MNQRVVEAQEELVRCIAGAAPENWIEFVGHFEIDADCGDALGSFLCDSGGRLIKADAMEPGRRNYNLYDLIRALWDAMNHEWNSITVRVDKSGRFRFAFSRELVRLADDGDLAYNPTTTLVEHILTHYPNQS